MATTKPINTNQDDYARPNKRKGDKILVFPLNRRKLEKPKAKDLNPQSSSN